MPLTLVTGPANSAKARALLDTVREHATRGRQPLLVVPTVADVAHYRRELAREGLVFGVTVTLFAGLIDELAHAAGGGPPPLQGLARERLVAAVAQRAPLRAMAGAVGTAGFARALCGLLAQLGSQRVSPARWAGALRTWAAADPSLDEWTADLQVLLDGYERALARLGRTDPERRAAAALDGLAREPRRWRGRPVCFYGFDDLAPLQLDAIETLARVVDAPVAVSLSYEAGRRAFAGRASTFQTLAPLAAEHVALPPSAAYYEHDALHHLERGLFETERPSQPRPPDGAVTLLEGGGERAELELVAGEIRALLDAGVPAGEIAVAVRASAPTAALLSEILATLDIPHTLRRRIRFTDTGLGRALTALVRCALTHADATDVLAWLRAPGVLERPELADRLEAALLSHAQGDAAAAVARWETEHWSLDAMRRLRRAEEQGPAALLGQVREEMGRLFAAPRGRSAAILSADEGDEARALAVATQALSELHELALAAPDLAGDGATLVAVLAELELEVGQHPREEAVAVLDPLALRARRVRALFVAGLQDGDFPSPPPAQPLLAEAQRAALARAAGLVLAARGDHLADERHLFYALASRPSQRLYLSWHAGDDDGSPASPSLFIDDVCDLFDEQLRATRRRRALGAASWPGAAARTPRGARREAALAGPRGVPEVIAPLRDPRVLGPLQGPESVWSASGLETYAGCPARWFVQRLLRVRALEPDPEPMSRGKLAHAVLEATLTALRERTGSARITRERLGLARALARAAIERLEPEHELTAAPERVPGARRRLQSDIDRYLEHAAATEAELEPRFLELDFGFAEGDHAALELGEGVRVRGRIDRVDVGGDGATAVVYDYKGRNAPEPARWLGDNRFQLAVYMRAAEQLLELHAVGGFYQPIGSSDLRGRGLLCEEAGLQLPVVNGDRRAAADVHELLDATLAVARRAAIAARAGELFGRPAGCGWMGRCEHPTICRCET